MEVRLLKGERYTVSTRMGDGPPIDEVKPFDSAIAHNDPGDEQPEKPKKEE